METEKQYVIFSLAEQLYGAGIRTVREVTRLTPITPLPNAPDFVEGVIDLRGEVMPVIDMRKRLKLPPREADGETRVMVLNIDGMTAGVIVDSLDEVVTLSEEEIAMPDARLVIPGQDYVIGVAHMGERLVVLIDLAEMLSAAA